MFEEIKKELQGKSDKAIHRYLKSIDLSSVIQYLKENSTYNDIPEKRKFGLVQDFLKGRNNICPVCGKIIEHELKNCSLRCRDLNPETRKKVRETNLKKFGAEHPMQSKEVREKTKNTNLERYGFVSPLQNKDVREKIKNTNIEKYGTEYPMQSKEVQWKYKETCLEKYGFEYALQNKDVQEKTKNTNIERYGVENPMQNKEVQEKYKETCLEKYGVENPSQNKDIQEKAKSTNLKRYGFEYSSQNKDVQEKTKNTNIERYGVENPMQNKEVQEKYKNTNLERYGTEHPMQNKDIQEKAKNTCLEHLGVEYPSQNKEVQEKTKNTNIERYGVENASQNKDIQEKYKETCIEKYGVENPSQSKIKNYDLYNDKNYIKENLFLDASTPNTKAIQEFFGITLSTCIEHMRKLFGDEIYHNTGTSNAERELQEYVKTLSQNVICNDRTIINPKELDIVLPDVGLCIEYDGSYWHSSEFVKENYHLEKTKLCDEKGYQLFHIFDFDDIDIWKSMISNKLKMNKVIYARKCVIKELKYNDVKDFLAENHLQGACTSKINLGLFYNDELVEVMTFSKPRFNKNYDYELLRLCSKKFYSVVGGASKLFKYFTSKNHGSIISYANRRFSNGNIYKQLGFKELKSSNPNYFYCKGDSILTRYQCQKHKLKDLYNKGILKEYDSELTESEIMDRNLYFRLYDCGNLVFEYIKSIDF